LSGCGLLGPDLTPAPNFCKAENRQIPDAELKARLLFQLRKVQKLPAYIEDYIRTNAKVAASDFEIVATIERFVRANPNCCHFVTPSIMTGIALDRGI
jgi:hypothetical protein